ncbi:MAG: hemerythrin domain-containing protein [Deltaproteobacteria bacterium]
MNAIDLIKAQHARIEELGRALLGVDPARRGGLLRQLERVIEAHSEMEEKLFYPVFNTPSSHEALVQYAEDHRRVRVLLLAIDHAGVASPQFERNVSQVMAAFAEHAYGEEEAQLLPLVEKRLGIVQLHVLGSEMLALYGELVAQPVEMNLEVEARHPQI